jgi:hypothetical protein
MGRERGGSDRGRGGGGRKVRRRMEGGKGEEKSGGRTRGEGNGSRFPHASSQNFHDVEATSPRSNGHAIPTSDSNLIDGLPLSPVHPLLQLNQQDLKLLSSRCHKLQLHNRRGTNQ